jgi:hypothetical protein
MSELRKGIYVDFKTKSQLFHRVLVLETLKKMSEELFSYFIGAYQQQHAKDGLFFPKMKF